jgi:hypothetical protein
MINTVKTIIKKLLIITNNMNKIKILSMKKVLIGVPIINI